MYGQRFTKDLAGEVTFIRYQLLGALGDTHDVPPDEPFVSSALTAAFRVHQASLALWQHSQRPESKDQSSTPEESTGQYNPPGSDPNPTLPELRVRLTLWLQALEKRLIEELHTAQKESRATHRQAFIDAGVIALRHMVQARRALGSESSFDEAD